MLDREKLLARRAELEEARQQVADEYQRLTGAIQLCDALVSELDDADKEKEQ